MASTGTLPHLRWIYFHPQPSPSPGHKYMASIFYGIRCSSCSSPLSAASNYLTDVYNLEYWILLNAHILSSRHPNFRKFPHCHPLIYYRFPRIMIQCVDIRADSILIAFFSLQWHHLIEVPLHHARIGYYDVLDSLYTVVCVLFHATQPSPNWRAVPCSTCASTIKFQLFVVSASVPIVLYTLPIRTCRAVPAQLYNKNPPTGLFVSAQYPTHGFCTKQTP